MAATSLSYTWQTGDVLFRVAGRYVIQSGYSNTSTFIEAIRNKNATIFDWQRVPSGTVITIPLLK